MNTSTPKFWALIGFGVGAVIAAGGSIAGPLDSLFGGLIQAGIWFGVSSLILRKKSSNVIKSRGVSGDKVCKYCKQEILPPSDECLICFPEQTFPGEPLERTCNYCKKRYSIKLKECPACFPEPITPKANQVKENKKQFVEPRPTAPPEFKICPMCAEEIKFAAKKCRFCQHMQD
jgi:hypothetical protein